ncbi:hypothetical protein QAD02_013422 [Eretmocerus hayati]|uniref:Uncharacterized protein n=1 Tax=Eretmocerus hayati TaxID=131215 RepID=A0ACC2P231_9HYME|nr:hypothetical protein QAD02_013422 [Eretmocerus hayati]
MHECVSRDTRVRGRSLTMNLTHRLPIHCPPTPPTNPGRALPIHIIQEQTEMRVIIPVAQLRQLAPRTWGIGPQEIVNQKEATTQEESTSQELLEKSAEQHIRVYRARGRFTTIDSYKPPTTRARGRATRWVPYVKYTGMARTWGHADDVATNNDAPLGGA